MCSASLIIVLTTEDTEITEEVLLIHELMHFMKKLCLFYNTHRDISFLASIPITYCALNLLFFV